MAQDQNQQSLVLMTKELETIVDTRQCMTNFTEQHCVSMFGTLNQWNKLAIHKCLIDQSPECSGFIIGNLDSRYCFVPRVAVETGMCASLPSYDTVEIIVAATLASCVLGFLFSPTASTARRVVLRVLWYLTRLALHNLSFITFCGVFYFLTTWLNFHVSAYCEDPLKVEDCKIVQAADARSICQSCKNLLIWSPYTPLVRTMSWAIMCWKEITVFVAGTKDITGAGPLEVIIRMTSYTYLYTNGGEKLKAFFKSIAPRSLPFDSAYVFADTSTATNNDTPHSEEPVSSPPPREEPLVQTASTRDPLPREEPPVQTASTRKAAAPAATRVLPPVPVFAHTTGLAAWGHSIPISNRRRGSSSSSNASTPQPSPPPSPRGFAPAQRRDSGSSAHLLD